MFPAHGLLGLNEIVIGGSVRGEFEERELGIIEVIESGVAVHAD
jgi:hypothetical protein